MKGVLIYTILIVTLLGLVTSFIIANIPKNSTDPVDGRSGLSIRTDALTGCQYLSMYGGGIYPRMNREGGQVCKD